MACVTLYRLLKPAMAASPLSNEPGKSKKVCVDFEGHQHCFRIVPNYTFSNLLSDCARHWLLDEDDYEIQDEDGSTWPSAGKSLFRFRVLTHAFC